MHLTGGILRHFRAFTTPEQNPAPEVLSMSAHPQVTRAVGRLQLELHVQNLNYEEGSLLTMSLQLDFVEKRIKEDIEFFTNRRNYNRKMAFRFSIFPAILSTIATIAIGVQDKFNLLWLPVVALVASGIASVLGAWQSLFANRTLWATNNSTLADLYKLQWDIEYRKADQDSPIKKEETDAYYERLSRIHDEAEDALQQVYKV